jgi:hypothetical protein
MREYEIQRVVHQGDNSIECLIGFSCYPGESWTASCASESPPDDPEFNILHIRRIDDKLDIVSLFSDNELETIEVICMDYLEERNEPADS